MSMNTLPIRHELKYFINERQYFVLSGVLDGILNRDPNGDEYNEYHIRSLYFDTVFNTALFDKLNGVQNRDKYRIRIYNFSDKIIKLECKTKVGSLISKRSISIPKLLCEQLMDGMGKLPHVKIYGPSDPKKHNGIVTFTIDGVHPHDISSVLNEDHVCIHK